MVDPPVNFLKFSGTGVGRPEGGRLLRFFLHFRNHQVLELWSLACLKHLN